MSKFPLAQLEDPNTKINFNNVYSLRDKVRDCFKKEFNCTKITEIKLLKRKQLWRANCFQYAGNRQFKFYGIRYIPNSEIEKI